MDRSLNETNQEVDKLDKLINTELEYEKSKESVENDIHKCKSLCKYFEQSCRDLEQALGLIAEGKFVSYEKSSFAEEIKENGPINNDLLLHCADKVCGSKTDEDASSRCEDGKENDCGEEEDGVLKALSTVERSQQTTPEWAKIHQDAEISKDTWMSSFSSQYSSLYNADVSKNSNQQLSDSCISITDAEETLYPQSSATSSDNESFYYKNTTDTNKSLTNSGRNTASHTTSSSSLKSSSSLLVQALRNQMRKSLDCFKPKEVFDEEKNQVSTENSELQNKISKEFSTSEASLVPSISYLASDDTFQISACSEQQKDGSQDEVMENTESPMLEEQGDFDGTQGRCKLDVSENMEGQTVEENEDCIGNESRSEENADSQMLTEQEDIVENECGSFILSEKEMIGNYSQLPNLEVSVKNNVIAESEEKLEVNNNDAGFGKIEGDKIDKDDDFELINQNCQLFAEDRKPQDQELEGNDEDNDERLVDLHCSVAAMNEDNDDQMVVKLNVKRQRRRRRQRLNMPRPRYRRQMKNFQDVLKEEKANTKPRRKNEADVLKTFRRQPQSRSIKKVRDIVMRTSPYRNSRTNGQKFTAKTRSPLFPIPVDCLLDEEDATIGKEEAVTDKEEADIHQEDAVIDKEEAVIHREEAVIDRSQMSLKRSCFVVVETCVFTPQDGSNKMPILQPKKAEAGKVEKQIREARIKFFENIANVPDVIAIDSSLNSSKNVLSGSEDSGEKSVKDKDTKRRSRRSRQLTNGTARKTRSKVEDGEISDKSRGRNDSKFSQVSHDLKSEVKKGIKTKVKQEHTANRKHMRKATNKAKEETSNQKNEDEVALKKSEGNQVKKDGTDTKKKGKVAAALDESGIGDASADAPVPDGSLAVKEIGSGARKVVQKEQSKNTEQLKRRKKPERLTRKVVKRVTRKAASTEAVQKTLTDSSESENEFKKKCIEVQMDVEATGEERASLSEKDKSGDEEKMTQSSDHEEKIQTISIESDREVRYDRKLRSAAMKNSQISAEKEKEETADEETGFDAATELVNIVSPRATRSTRQKNNRTALNNVEQHCSEVTKEGSNANVTATDPFWKGNKAEKDSEEQAESALTDKDSCRVKVKRNNRKFKQVKDQIATEEQADWEENANEKMLRQSKRKKKDTAGHSNKLSKTREQTQKEKRNKKNRTESGKISSKEEESKPDSEEEDTARKTDGDCNEEAPRPDFGSLVETTSTKDENMTEEIVSIGKKAEEKITEDLTVYRREAGELGIEIAQENSRKHVSEVEEGMETDNAEQGKQVAVATTENPSTINDQNQDNDKDMSLSLEPDEVGEHLSSTLIEENDDTESVKCPDFDEQIEIGKISDVKTEKRQKRKNEKKKGGNKKRKGNFIEKEKPLEVGKEEIEIGDLKLSCVEKTYVKGLSNSKNNDAGLSQKGGETKPGLEQKDIGAGQASSEITASEETETCAKVNRGNDIGCEELKSEEVKKKDGSNCVEANDKPKEKKVNDKIAAKEVNAVRRSARKVKPVKKFELDKENIIEEMPTKRKAPAKRPPLDESRIPSKRRRTLFNNKNNSLVSIGFSMLQDTTFNTSLNRTSNVKNTSFVPKTLQNFLQAFVAPKLKKKSS